MECLLYYVPRYVWIFWVLDVEHASFTPLVMSATGGMAPIATSFYSRLASMISEKKGLPYHQTIGWIRCKLSFALLRMSIMCIRGSRPHLQIHLHQQHCDTDC